MVSSAVCLCGCCVTFKEEEEGLEKDEKKLKEVRRGKKVLEGREQSGNYKVELWIRGGDNQPSDSRLQCPCPQLSAEVQALSCPEVINMLFWMYFGSRFSLVIERLGRTRSGVSEEVSFTLFPPLNKPSASYNLGLQVI